MTDSTVWWLIAGSLVAAELMTGTFYLLMLATGMAAAAIAAHLGATFTVEVVVAAMVGGGSVVAWRTYKQKMPSAPPAGANHDVNLDVGETVHVEAWNPDGTGEVKYRGATMADLPDAGCRTPAGHLRHRGGGGQPAGCAQSVSIGPPGLSEQLEKSMEIAIVLFVIAVIFVTQSVKVVPQQHAWVVERLGKYNGTLTPGLSLLMPFVDKVAYKHLLKEVPLDIPSQVCITRDNTQLQVDGILYFQVTDAMRASYGSSNYIMAISQLAQTSLRSVIGKLELDKTFEERDIINAQVVQAIDEAALNWGVKVLRYEIKDLTPPKEILHAMQQQITAEREKRALIAASEGRRQEQINIATGEREAFIARSEGEKQAVINKAQGDAAVHPGRGRSHGPGDRTHRRRPSGNRAARKPCSSRWPRKRSRPTARSLLTPPPR